MDCRFFSCLQGFKREYVDTATDGHHFRAVGLRERGIILRYELDLECSAGECILDSVSQYHRQFCPFGFSRFEFTWSDWSYIFRRFDLDIGDVFIRPCFFWVERVFLCAVDGHNAFRHRFQFLHARCCGSLYCFALEPQCSAKGCDECVGPLSSVTVCECSL